MNMDIPKETLLMLYRNLLTARRIDEKHYEIYSAGGSGMPWLHRGIGQEAVSIAICANLKKDDYFKPCFRMRFCLFAKGLSIKDIIASEIVRDIIKDGGNSFYLNPEYGILGFSGSGGEDAGFYVGAALSAKMRKTDQITVYVNGDGFSNRGSVHEAIVAAVALNLPVVFMIENNQYAMGTRSQNSYKMDDLSDRAKGYGMPGESVDGNDILAIYEVVKKHVKRARSGGGPSLIVAETYRLRGHFEGDPQIYRPKGEVEEWWKKDPLPRYQKKLMDMGLLTDADINRIEAEVKNEINEAAEAALAIPRPSYEDHVKTVIGDL
ncbi:MAG: thiamine pyrophosphate-dependent dehydrogenase E1 component subunit alpha [Dehalococcoidales bacterium]|nr:thiamine pyrophosphate-dependent dehydrogenase E1 component subunit alpha [Dehalococcoidales bacterium]